MNTENCSECDQIITDEATYHKLSGLTLVELIKLQNQLEWPQTLDDDIRARGIAAELTARGEPDKYTGLYNQIEELEENNKFLDEQNKDYEGEIEELKDKYEKALQVIDSLKDILNDIGGAVDDINAATQRGSNLEVD